MKRKVFIFNINKCVSCMACVAGCSIENGTLPGMNWRVVNGYNKIHHPDLPVFHFSLACNHCEEAVCMQNCPALAYTRDEETRAIIHHAEACIGCKLCTWACPYDAPKFNQHAGVVEKCNFCVDRIADDQAPACVDACPVEALTYGYEEITDEDILTPGFVNQGIRPAIKIIPLREHSAKPEIWNIDSSIISTDEAIHLSSKPLTKVRLSKEWSLVLFTLSVACLVGWFGANISHDVTLKLQRFLPAALVAMLISSIHLGKRFRAWRSVLNIKKSWLSREIFSFSLFMGSVTLYLILHIHVIAYLALASGLLTLLSVDMLYQLFERREKISIHSALILTTGVLVYSYLAQMEFLLGFILSLKLGLYLYRKIIFIKLKSPYLVVPSLIRISTLIISIVLWVSSVTIPLWLIPCLLLLGEIIDRSEFYYEAEIPSPEKALFDLQKEMSNE